MEGSYKAHVPQEQIEDILIDYLIFMKSQGRSVYNMMKYPAPLTAPIQSETIHSQTHYNQSTSPILPECPCERSRAVSLSEIQILPTEGLDRDLRPYAMSVDESEMAPTNPQEPMEPTLSPEPVTEPTEQNPEEMPSPWPGIIPEDMDQILPEEELERDMRYLKLLYSDLSKRILPIIDSVLKEYEYDGSPIYDEQMSREALGQIVDKVISEAQKNMNPVEEITLDEDRYYWGKYFLLNTLVESLILNEIYGCKRPNYRRYHNYYPLG